MSSKNLIWTVLIFALLIIGTATSALALQEEFNAYSAKETINVCACDLTQDSLFVQNTGDLTSTYLMFKEGEAADWSTYAPDSFYLEQGERKEVKNFLNVPCKARGDYELTTKVKTLFDYEKTLTQTVHVDNCANVQLVQKSFTQETCPCSPVTYEFEITNTGQHTESYRLSVTPFEDSASVSDPLLVLEPGQSHTVYAFLSLPCDINGQQEFTLQALAEGTGILGELDFNLMIDSCYDFRLEPEEEYNICANMPNAATIPIKNIVDIANKYTLSVEGPAWAYFQNDTVFAWGMQQTAGTLMLEPTDLDLLTEEGEVLESFPLTVTAVTERGELVESKNFTVNVENCYDLNVVLREYEEFGIKGTTENYGVLLENSGTRETTYFVEAFGPEWTYLNSEAEFTLQSGQTKEVLVTADIPFEADDDPQDISIVGTIPEFNIMRSNSFMLTPVSLEDAYRLDIAAEDVTINVEGDVIIIPVTNVGVMQSEYVAEVTAPEWVLTENRMFSLEPGQNTSLVLHAVPPEEILGEEYMITVEVAPAGTELFYTTDFTMSIGKQSFMSWLAAHWLLLLLILLPIIAAIIVLIILLVRRRNEEQFKEELQEGKGVKLEKIHEEEQSETGGRWWIIPLITLIILAILLGIGAYIAVDAMNAVDGENATVVEEPILEEPVLKLITDDQGLVVIDRTAVPGEGNVLEVDEPVQMVLELEVTNPTDKNAIFRLGVENAEESWITIPQEELYIRPHETEDAELIITPDMEVLKDVDYSINVTYSLTGEQIDYQNSVGLVVEKKKGFFDSWWPWIIAGLLIAILAVILIALVKRSKGDETEEVVPVRKAHYYEPIDDEPREKSKVWKTILIILAILALVLAVFAAGWFFAGGADREIVDSEPEEVTEEPVVEETTEEPTETVEEQDALVQLDLSGYPGQDNYVLVEDNQTMEFNITVTNPSDERAQYTAIVSDDSWISVEEPSIELAPNTQYQTKITVIPNMTVLKKQDYSIGINSTLESETGSVDYSQNLELVLKGEKGFFQTVWPYILIGLLLAGLAILFIIFVLRREKEERIEIFSEPKEEKPKKEVKPKKPAEKKKRTSLKLDKKKK